MIRKQRSKVNLPGLQTLKGAVIRSSNPKKVVIDGNKQHFQDRKNDNERFNEKFTPVVNVCRATNTSVSHSLGDKYNVPSTFMNRPDDNDGAHINLTSPMRPSGSTTCNYDKKQHRPHIKPQWRHSDLPTCSLQPEKAKALLDHEQVCPFFILQR